MLNNELDLVVQLNKKAIQYNSMSIFLSMAGSGNPWEYFRPSSKLTLRALHDGHSLELIQEILQMTAEDLEEKLNLLVEASLVRKDEGVYYPTFFIADKDESYRTFMYAKEVGKLLAGEIKASWDEIEKEFSKLVISQNYSIKDLGFVLVGSKILDIGFLESLVKDKTLLVSAPNRPSPNHPDAQYYFFMIEGDVDYLGKYGEESMDLPWENWHFVTFGKNIIDGKSNEPRNKIEEKCDELRKNNILTSPEELAAILDVPILSKDDSLAWRNFAMKIANRLLSVVKEMEKKLLAFYNQLKASKYTNNSLGEFMCWLMHVVYAWAIDFLIEDEILYMPTNKFSTLVIYAIDPQGLLVE